MEKFILWCIAHGLCVLTKYDHCLGKMHFTIFKSREDDPDLLTGKISIRETCLVPISRKEPFYVCIDMLRFKEYDEESKSNIFDEALRTTKGYFNFEE